MPILEFVQAYWTTTAIVVINLGLVLVARGGLLRVADHYLKREKIIPADVDLKSQFHPSLFLFLFSIIYRATLPYLDFSKALEAQADHLLGLLLIVAVTWLLAKLISLVRIILFQKFDVTATENISQRKARTQIQYLEKLLVILVCLVGFCMILLSFDGFRKIGTSILTSAGILGVVVGFAAQKFLGNILAGLQLVFTQPIRLDDVVVIEGEFGRVEEISLTYVVVHIWDKRRLIVPVNYFIEKPFQNWTKTSSDLLGAVFLYVDFSVPMNELRVELKRILENSEQWDKNVCSLQVTDISEKTLKVRALVSAKNASAAWDLRCIVREKLVEYIRQRYPEALPQTRFVQATAASTTGHTE